MKSKWKRNDNKQEGVVAGTFSGYLILGWFLLFFSIFPTDFLPSFAAEGSLDACWLWLELSCAWMAPAHAQRRGGSEHPLCLVPSPAPLAALKRGLCNAWAETRGCAGSSWQG